MKHQNKILKNSFILLAMIFFASVIGVLFKKLGFDNTNVVSGYIFAVLVVARFTDGYVFGLLATVMSTALFNLLFTEPYYTFKINNFSDIITFVIMIIISIMTGALTASVREATKDAKLKEIENRTLYELTNHLTDAKDIDSIGVFSTKAVYDFLSCKVGWINFDEEGSFNGKLIQMRENGTLIHREFILDEKELFNSMKNLRTEYYEMDDYCDFPVTNQKTVLAVLMLPKKIVYDMNISQKRMIHGIIESSALAIERFRSI